MALLDEETVLYKTPNSSDPLLDLILNTMPNSASTLPKPLLVLISGKPGSGKSTLAQKLSKAEHLGMPVLSRDAIKSAMVETFALSQPELPRNQVETGELRSKVIPASFNLFYKTMTEWLEAGVSLIAEYQFSQRTEKNLTPIIQLANTVHIYCDCSRETARDRFFKREEKDGLASPERLKNITSRIEAGTDTWRTFEALNLNLPRLVVDTQQGYQPDLHEISSFCRRQYVEG